MKYILIKDWILPIKGYSATTIYPFIFSNGEISKRTLRHEKIHLVQQVESLLIPFYALYLINYLINLAVYRDKKKAYRNICFEREAFSNENNVNYSKERKIFSWIKYL